MGRRDVADWDFFVAHFVLGHDLSHRHSEWPYMTTIIQVHQALASIRRAAHLSLITANASIHAVLALKTIACPPVRLCTCHTDTDYTNTYTPCCPFPHIIFAMHLYENVSSYHINTSNNRILMLVLQAKIIKETNHQPPSQPVTSVMYLFTSTLRHSHVTSLATPSAQYAHWSLGGNPESPLSVNCQPMSIRPRPIFSKKASRRGVWFGKKYAMMFRRFS